MQYDYTSIGFYTFDCLGRPVTAIAPGGNTYFIDEVTMAVSGAAGAAAIVAAKYGMRVCAVGGIGDDLMGEWVIRRLGEFGIDTSMMQLCPGVGTSSSIVTTRPDGQRPALHMRGATGAFVIDEKDYDRILDAKIIHIGGTGLMDRMDGERSFRLMAEAKRRNLITTLDVFAADRKDMENVAGLLPYTDYFIPSIEEARALSGLQMKEDIGIYFNDLGVQCTIMTMGEAGAYYHHADGTRFHMPAFEIDVVCTCGCGDAFNAGFAAGLLEGYGPEEATRLAQASSALNATGLGSQAGIVDLETTLAFIEGARTKAVVQQA
ncbi:sugar/nucleoside kinase (ribokinase family) [Sinorhizobium fredii]|uniref:Putative sugar kinase YdjH n=1 Tax=Sinorhizobium fredii (strain USDA 257) TaxID=1185652 RepID=I3X3N8_SINF2|nr:sugar kinase [Sinorhizobium fredii]AFL50494.1 putative sugar kinase YdjH [Sinorhizobium fredii USDA 257]